MSVLGNVLWLILGGGIILFLEYAFGGLILCITIVGIPFGIQCFKLAGLALFPFGREVEAGKSHEGCLAIVMNVIWIVCGGIWVALTHIVFMVLCAITIIGIPFSKQHLKLAALSLAPFGKRVK